MPVPDHQPAPDSWSGHLWWELRRLVYNAVLLVIGGATVAGCEWLITKMIPLGDDVIEPMGLVVGAVVYGAIANLFYTLGWIIELRGRKDDPVAARRQGQWMFRAGLLFPCVLTSLPFWFACLMWGLHRFAFTGSESRSARV